MPMDRSEYPTDWDTIAAAVRDRSLGRCECRGECGIDHERDPIVWDDFEGDDPLDHSPRCLAEHGRGHPVTSSRVVLTAAHLWRGPCAAHHKAGVKCGDASHLKAMCQRCHLAYDREQHVANARRNRRARKATGDLFE